MVPFLLARRDARTTRRLASHPHGHSPQALHTSLRRYATWSALRTRDPSSKAWARRAFPHSTGSMNFSGFRSGAFTTATGRAGLRFAHSRSPLLSVTAACTCTAVAESPDGQATLVQVILPAPSTHLMMLSALAMPAASHNMAIHLPIAALPIFTGCICAGHLRREIPAPANAGPILLEHANGSPSAGRPISRRGLHAGKRLMFETAFTLKSGSPFSRSAFSGCSIGKDPS